LINKNKNYFDLNKLQILANQISFDLRKGSVLFLKGELGVGKTTFARFIINKVYEINNLTKPNSIKSPSFPILLTYDLGNLEIFHYDLYRIKNISELSELSIEENIENSITLIEWPELMLDKNINYKYHLIEIKMHNEFTRLVEASFIN